MQTRQLGTNGPRVSTLGLGCMAMSGAYGPAERAESIATIHAALDAGITLLDTGDFYGQGHNELLIQRLGVEHIDIYRPARLDRNVPIEETIGAIAASKTGSCPPAGSLASASPRTASCRAVCSPGIGAGARGCSHAGTTSCRSWERGDAISSTKRSVRSTWSSPRMILGQSRRRCQRARWPAIGIPRRR